MMGVFAAPPAPQQSASAEAAGAVPKRKAAFRGGNETPPDADDHPGGVRWSRQCQDRMIGRNQIYAPKCIKHKLLVASRGHRF